MNYKLYSSALSVPVPVPAGYQKMLSGACLRLVNKMKEIGRNDDTVEQSSDENSNENFHWLCRNFNYFELSYFIISRTFLNVFEL